jgi:hypothetical protein
VVGFLYFHWLFTNCGFWYGEWLIWYQVTSRTEICRFLTIKKYQWSLKNNLSYAGCNISDDKTEPELQRYYSSQYTKKYWMDVSSIVIICKTTTTGSLLQLHTPTVLKYVRTVRGSHYQQPRVTFSYFVRVQVLVEYCNLSRSYQTQLNMIVLVLYVLEYRPKRMESIHLVLSCNTNHQSNKLCSFSYSENE